ncbi:putative peptidylprolyl isomerase [Medicago truncatula]|uniref:Putative peptidylprolyl isomerase n=1 Tax=Medicago truncatula TaxID=3880 RepID=A0A396JVH4_MEDTR|nr:FHA domain-containing protein PS1 isoform X1 [Medicago truncatula]RHN81552.1 putative peptidylprolyl isomerase [Medicago truncatula]
MASIVVSDDNPNQQQQSLIPVLTVFKNNSILKNIIILNNNNNNNKYNDDQILLVGRHPNCNIVLFHPSISRFHLQIRFNPSSRSISLLDLSSVHGTWVCGRKLEHGVSVDLKEGDTFQLGSSSRVYLLQFVSQFDDVDALKNIGSLGCDDKRKDQSNDETFEDENDSFGTETSCCNGENKLCGCHFCLLSPPYTQSVDETDNIQMGEACPEVEMPGETNLFCTLRECFQQNICIPVAEAVQGSKLHQQSSAEKQLIDPESSFGEKGDGAVDEVPKESEFEGTFEYIVTTGGRVFNSEDMPCSESHQTNTNEEVSVDSLSDGEKQGSCGEEYESELQNLNANSCHKQQYSPDEIVEDIGKQCIENMDPASSEENGVAALSVTPKEHKLEFFSEENDMIDDVLSSVARFFNSENTSSLVKETIHHVTNFQQINTVEEVAAVDSLSDEEKENKCDVEFKAYLNIKPCDEEGNSLVETVEETVKSFQTESVNPLSVNTYSLVEDSIPVTNFQLINIVDEVATVDSLSDEEKENECDEEFKAYLYVKPCDEGSSLDETVEETVKSFQTESLNPSSGNTSSLVEEAIPVTNFQLINIVEEVATVDSLSNEEKENECDEEFKAYLYVKPCDEEGNSLDETVEETVKSFQTESLNPSVTQETDLEITEKKENQTLQSLVAVAGCFDVKFHENCVEESVEGSLTLGSDILSRRDKAASAPQDRTRKSRLLNTPDVDTKFVMSNLKDINIINKPMPQNIFSDLDEEEMFTPNKENSSPTNTFHSQFMRKKGVLEESKSSKSQRAHNLKASFSSIIYSAERCTSAISNKENQTPKSQRAHNLKASFSPIIYSAERSTSAISNKENLTPREAREWKSQRSHNLRASFSPIIYSAERSASAISNKENLTPKEALEWMSGRNPLECRNTMELRKKRVERMPLQSLISSGGNHNSNSSPFSSSPFSAAKSILGVTVRSSNCGHISDKHAQPSRISAERKRSWDLVVDTSSLLNKESRKALQLLQGLKRTRLIIPQSVIRELGSMKQQIGIFRRISEAALALEWIEECIGKTKWWIHIQSSMEDEFRLIAPTPPTQFNEDVLDCALQYRRKDNVGQIVLLSDDVNLKIKSMAKGLLSETVQQFRQSLVNPFSERFMWANSSPRGLTWSCRDDVVLREKYCCLPSKAGLKLLAT